LFRLPFGRQAWRGAQGNWLGVGLGSSIDFQDHRAYAPGDDPRYIHWAAYARTGQLTMKLFRAEVAPLVDLAIDTSASMTFDPAKAGRTDELLAFCVQSADQAGAPVRVHAVDGTNVRAVPLEWVRAARWRERLPARPLPAPVTGAAPGRLPWRPGALKVLISDLLFPGEPGAVLGPLAAGSGLALVLAPALASERELAARGNLELLDCESVARRRQRIDDALAGRYRAAYQRHFALWDEGARQRGVLLAAVACEGDLKDALAGVPLRRGVVDHQT
jgi:uncharacterized protein (DUF58 family)